MIRHLGLGLLLAVHQSLCSAWQQPVDFRTEIIPVLTKSGCNAGDCHGAAAGRGNLHLSLFGADPATDYQSIVHAFEGRRVNRVHPAQSLLLRKPLAELEHGGGMVLDPTGPEAARILDWLTAGAPLGAPRRLTSLNVTPRFQLCQPETREVPISVKASFNGRAEDEVTRWATFTSSDPTAVSVNEHGVAEIHRRGQHVVIVRFLDRVVPVQLAVPLNDAVFDLPAESPANFIDRYVLDKLSEMRIPVSPMASDEVWLRRITLDLTGRVPQLEQVERFLNDVAADKRIRYVDQLLTSDAFTDYWTWRIARLLRMHSLPHEKEAFDAYRQWLHEVIAGDAGLDVAAGQLLTATGDSHLNGPANFSRMVMDARAQAELVGDVFAGIRIGCANCHNHPTDRWTQDDYHGLAAIFAKVVRSRQVSLGERGDVTNPRTGAPASPRIPGLHDLPQDGDQRREVVRWILESPDRYFARATVNRMWQAMFGRGLVDPADDLRETNPATHPELLTALAEEFVAQGYRIRPTLRQIALSDTYARSSQTLPENVNDDRFYSHAYARPLAPEVLVDAIADVTGVPDDFPEHGVDRAVRVIDTSLPAGSLDALGRCRSGSGCSRDPASSQGLSVQLHLLNGDVINQKIRSPDGHLQHMIAAGETLSRIVEAFVVRGLARQPTPSELARWETLLADPNAEERARKLEDFVWSLLNSRAFRENQ